MTKILWKGQTAIKIGDEVNVLFFIKKGALKVTKQVVVPDDNYWPLGDKVKSEMKEKQTIRKNFMKELFFMKPT